MAMVLSSLTPFLVRSYNLYVGLDEVKTKGVFFF